MLIAIALDVLVAYLLTRVLFKWWAWLPATVLAGASISIATGVAMAVLGLQEPQAAGYQGVMYAPLHAAVCSLYAWWLRRRVKA